MTSERTANDKPAMRTAALLLVIAFALAYIWFAARMFQASRLASSLDVPSLQRAIALEPHQAAYRDLLCRFLLFDKQEATSALPSCKRATELNPYHSTYWLDLALAYYSVGEEQQHEQALLHAVSVDPTTPDVAWNAANFFLSQGKTQQALQQFAVAMRGDPNLVQQSLDLCWRATHDGAAIQSILPPDPAAYLQFIRLLMNKNQWDAAQQVWSAMLLLDGNIDGRQAVFYVDGLLARRDVKRAEQAWEQLAQRSANWQDYSHRDDLVVNGGFEHPSLNAGFDWRYSPQPASKATIDATDFHGGSQSLSILYTGVNGDSGLLQYAPVKPDTQYHLTAWVRSQDLEGANGPVISVSDAYADKLYAATTETLGTTGWHRLEASFQTGSDTELVAIRMRRDPGNTLIRGTFWVDDISLRASGGSEPK